MLEGQVRGGCLKNADNECQARKEVADTHFGYRQNQASVSSVLRCFGGIAEFKLNVGVSQCQDFDIAAYEFGRPSRSGVREPSNRYLNKTSASDGLT